MKIIEINKQGAIVQFTKNELYGLRKKEMKEMTVSKILMIIFWIALILMVWFMFNKPSPTEPPVPTNILAPVFAFILITVFTLAIIYTIRYLIKWRRLKEIYKAYSEGELTKNRNSQQNTNSD